MAKIKVYDCKTRKYKIIDGELATTESQTAELTQDKFNKYIEDYLLDLDTRLLMLEFKDFI